MKAKPILDKETNADVYALGDLSPEMAAIVEALLEHTDDGTGKPVCGAVEFEPDLLVDSSLASDCAACRNVRMIGNMKEHKQREVPVWTPQPMADADTMVAAKQRRSDGHTAACEPDVCVCQPPSVPS